VIPETPDDLTAAVLAELGRAQDPRLRELLTLGVRHLHAFVREAALTEAEFRRVCALVAELGQRTTASHNEVVLMAGSLGVSALVCRINNGDGGRTTTTANLMGPFWRDGAPAMRNGESIVRSPTPGEPLFVRVRVQDAHGRAVDGARIDVWQASAEGLYENQDPLQADMNLRGVFTTDAQGRIEFRTVKPVGYPIPVSGPVGALLKSLGRHNLRPAHVHFMVFKPGFKTQFAQVYADDDPNLESDVQFGVTRALVGRYVRHEAGEPAPAADVAGPWYALEHVLVVEPGEAALPKPPIAGKAGGERAALVVLERKP